MILVDDKGHGDSDQLVLGASGCPQALGTDEYLLLCKDGAAIVYIVVPHDSDALESQGAYRMIPMRTVYGEDITAPFAVADGGDDDDGRRRR